MANASQALSPIQWPPKHNLFGVLVSSTTYDETLALVMCAARNRIPTLVDHMPVHGLMEASQNQVMRKKINEFDVVAPDGQPVRWALNHLHATKLSERVYGPELMVRLCDQSAREGIGIFLYGSYASVIQKLRTQLLSRFPTLRIVGCEAPPFRPLTQKEDKETVYRIKQSGAGIVFLGLGCPKQEIFAHEHRHQIQGVQVCVGAAFDFLAGTKKMAPKWMQRTSLEWLFRLIQEPRRLWRRYFVTNTMFLGKTFWQLIYPHQHVKS